MARRKTSDIKAPKTIYKINGKTYNSAQEVATAFKTYKFKLYEWLDKGTNERAKGNTPDGYKIRVLKIIDLNDFEY